MPKIFEWNCTVNDYGDVTACRPVTVRTSTHQITGPNVPYREIMTREGLPTIMKTIVQTGAEPAKDVRALIIDKVGKGSYRPLELFKALEQQGVSEARLKDALDSLIDEHVVELSPDRILIVKIARRP